MLIYDSPMLGGMQYPFPQAGWSIQSMPLEDSKEFYQTLREAKNVCCRWVKDNKVNDLFVPGFTNPDDWLKATGLEVSLDKGVFQWSKRFSRIMRPYFFWGFFDDVRVKYDPKLDTKQFDGAGYISRKFLKRLNAHLPDHKRVPLERELKQTRRWEFTMLSERGEDKGHVIVKDEMKYDIILPMDTKLDLKLTTGQTFVGVSPVHSADAMWLDVQSMINLHPFFNPDWLIEKLDAMGKKFLEDIRNGTVGDLMSYVKSEEDIAGWGVREYFVSGGQSMWFYGIVTALGGQHVKMVNARSLEKLRTPIPGGRYYILSADVAGREIPDGHVQLDPELASAIVSERDWVELSAIWGGADQDDGMWCYPFIDQHGEKQVLMWRSPNQLGEYALLKPHGDIPWASWEVHDTNLLPTRIDQRETTYLGLVRDVPWVSEPYSIKACNKAIKTAIANIGALGQTVNVQMVMKALTGDIPDVQPDALERIIDGQVKLGSDLNAVKDYNTSFVRAYFLKHPHVPQILMPRIINMIREQHREFIQPTVNHWLDRFYAQMQQHIHNYRQQLVELAAEAMPPISVFEYGKGHLHQAARVREAYADVMREVSRVRISTEEDYNRARRASEAVLREYPEAEWTRIMAAIAIRTYVMSEPQKLKDGSIIYPSDSAMWQMGEMDEASGKRLPGMMDISIRMLREIGLLGELVQTDWGMVAYYAQDELVETGSPLRINAVWFNYANALREREGKPRAQKQNEIPKADNIRIKRNVGEWADQGVFNGQQMEVRVEGDRKTVWKNGKLLGYIHRGHELRVGEMLTPKYVTAYDGNLLMVVKES